VQILELDDVVTLLRREVEQAGSQTAWSKKTGIDRATLNQVLKGRRSPTQGILAALNLRTVFTPRGSARPKGFAHREPGRRRRQP
jgi:DNA-binding phage protein